MTQKADGYYPINVNRRRFWHVIHNKKIDIMNQTGRSNVTMKEAIEQILQEWQQFTNNNDDTTTNEEINY